MSDVSKKMSNSRYLKILIKILGFILIIILFFWNAFLTFLILILLNLKTLRKAVFGRLPLEFNKNAFEGPVTYTYKEDSIPLKLDIYYPTKKRELYPAIFFAHGGGWISGSRKLSSVTTWSKFLASRGFSVIAIDYRYSYFHSYEELIQDSSAALDYIRNNSNHLKIDKNKIVLMGTSAGGTLSLYYAAFNTFYNNLSAMKGIKGVIAWYAPADLLDLWRVDSLFARVAVVTTMKGSPNRKIEDYKMYSPINYVSTRMCPTLLVHGEKDTTVPVESSKKLYKKLKEQGVQAKLLIHPDGNHSFELDLKDFLTIKYVERTVSFAKDLCE